MSALPRLAVLTCLLGAGPIAIAGCGDDAPLGKPDAGAAKVTDGTSTGQLMTSAIDTALPSVVAVSVTRGGITTTGSGTVLTDGYVVTDAALVGSAAPAPTPRPTPKPKPTPAAATPQATTPTGTTPESTTPSATTPTGTTPAPAGTPKPVATPRPLPKLPAPAIVTVREASGEEHPGTVEGTDAVSGLAVLRVGDLDAVPVAKGGRAPELGEQVAAVGYLSARRPAVRPGSLVTVGRAARRDREVEVGLVEATAPLGAQGYGGPLVDGKGQVVGITTRVLPSVVPGTVVALPYASALRITKALADRGRVRRAYLGLDTVGITPDRAEELRLSTSSGVLIRTIVSGSPASFSTLKRPTGMTRIGGRLIPTGSDVIAQIDGTAIKEPEDLDAALATKEPGQRVALRVIRGSKGLTVHVTLGER